MFGRLVAHLGKQPSTYSISYYREIISYSGMHIEINRECLIDTPQVIFISVSNPNTNISVYIIR